MAEPCFADYHDFEYIECGADGWGSVDGGSIGVVDQDYAVERRECTCFEVGWSE